MSKSVIAMMKYYGWTSCSILSQDIEPWRETAHHLEVEAENEQVRINEKKEFGTSPVDPKDVEKLLAETFENTRSEHTVTVIKTTMTTTMTMMTTTMTTMMTMITTMTTTMGDDDNNTDDEHNNDDDDDNNDNNDDGDDNNDDNDDNSDDDDDNNSIMMKTIT